MRQQLGTFKNEYVCIYVNFEVAYSVEQRVSGRQASDAKTAAALRSLLPVR